MGDAVDTGALVVALALVAAVEEADPAEEEGVAVTVSKISPSMLVMAANRSLGATTSVEASRSEDTPVALARAEVIASTSTVELELADEEEDERTEEGEEAAEVMVVDDELVSSRVALDPPLDCVNDPVGAVELRAVGRAGRAVVVELDSAS